MESCIIRGLSFTQSVDSETCVGAQQLVNVDFSMKMGDGVNAGSAYDANGNIKSMSQTGLKLTASSPIDELTYTYQPNSNRLKCVVDAVNDNTSTLGDFKYDAGAKGSDDYTYDAICSKTFFGPSTHGELFEIYRFKTKGAFLNVATD